MQQYTCPKCLQNYTEATAMLHVPCGTVEAPKEQTITLPEPIDNKPIVFVNPALEKADLQEDCKPIEMRDETTNMVGNELLAVAREVYEHTKPIPIQQKKRGRPAKAK